MAYLLAGPLVALLGIAAVFFVLRRKSVEKRSMYSARRQQIEHKVRAARQRTLAPHGHAPKPLERGAEGAPQAAQPSAFDQAQRVQPTMTYQYQAPAYEAPPIAPPAPPAAQPAPAAPMPWDTPAAPAPAPDAWDFPPTAAVPAPAAPKPTPVAPTEPAWTPAPVKPAEPLTPAQTAAPAAASTAAGSWEVVSSTKDSAATAPHEGKKRKGKEKAETMTGSSWSLASGDSLGMDAAEETELKRPSGTIVAVAQYAVLVVGLVMVLIGVLVMVANSHVT